MRTKLSFLAGALALALVLAACGDDGTDAEGTEESPRTIEVTALDELAFDPSTIEIETGETVTFVVTNADETDHEFVVGDEAMQMEHEEEMDGGMDMGEEESEYPALEIAPGETVEATVTFTEAGELLYGCHIDGHYAGGMVGTISVG